VTPPTTRSLPFTLHGAPAVIAGAAPEARPPVTSQANEATLADTKARREELFIISNNSNSSMKRPNVERVVFSATYLMKSRPVEV
jgi:hypothetical protein